MLTILGDPQKVDMENPRDIIKGVQVGVVCVVFLSNLSLIFSKVSRKGCALSLFTARYAIQISLAFAGIVSALYSNLVTAIILFDLNNHGLNCMTTYLGNVYFYTFMPLIYCTGLILLALDLILRFKSDVYNTLGKSRMYAVLCAILPWAIAFAVSCPFTLTDIQWHLKCANTQSNQHLQAEIICSSIAPAVVVIIVAIVVAATVRPKSYYDFQRSFDSPMYSISNVTTSSSHTDCNMNGTQGSIKKINGSSTGNASSPVPIGSTADADAYPSFTNSKGKSLSREKCKLMFSMLFVAINILPYGCLFVYITTEYERLYTTLLLYMVDYEPYLSYYALSNVLNLYQIVIPLVWLCTRY